jgi:hypothetical protein
MAYTNDEERKAAATQTYQTHLRVSLANESPSESDFKAAMRQLTNANKERNAILSKSLAVM